MVKTLSTALVALAFLVAQSRGQEVFSGEQKAKPKYPKAQPAATDRVKSDLHVEKAIPVSTDKIAVAPKKDGAIKAPAVASAKAATPLARTADAPGKTAGATTTPVRKETASAIATVQHSTAKPAVKSVPKVEIAVAKQEATVPAPAEGPKQKSTAAVKAAVAKSSTVVDPVRHASAAQVSGAKASSSDAAQHPTSTEFQGKRPNVISSAGGGTVVKSSPKVEIAVAKPAADAKITAPKNSVVESHNAQAKPASVTVIKPVTVQHPAPLVQGVQHPIAERTTAKPALALDATRNEQKPDTKVQSHFASSTAVITRKETTIPASAIAKSMPTQSAVVETTVAQPISNHYDTAFTKLADGFDFPVGKPDAQGYYKARGFRSHGHLGEDWDGVRGGDTDLGDPIYSIGDGLVVFARDCHMGWGNVLIVRHSYREGGTVKTVDALYGHLQTMLVHRGQAVGRGQKIATMGNAHGLYDAHLHLEVRKNLEIGMSRAAFAQDFSNYYDPTQFIQEHRHLQAGGGSYRVAMNTFTRDARIKWDKARNYAHAHTGGGSSQSAAALKKALADQH
jgi:murein DD-endopeptidase MepM/ murein hydrolase activator NlpD